MSTLNPLSPDAIDVWSYQELRAEGISRAQIEWLLRAGQLERLRRDVYVRADCDATLKRALRVGGRLACASAAAHLRLWTPSTDRLHIHVWKDTTRHRDPDDRRARLPRSADVVLHWSAVNHGEGTRCSTSVIATIQQISACLGPLDATRVADSAVQRGRLTLAEARGALDGVMIDGLHASLVVDGLSGSGYETDAKVLLMRAGIRFRAQVRIEGVGWVDFVLEGLVIFEVDGREHHESSFDSDRRRDLEAMRQGYIPIRVSGTQLVQDPDGVLAALVRALAIQRRALR